MVIKLQIKLWLPAAVVRLGLWLMLLYRRLRYGYPFRRIKLTRGYFAIVDPEDYAWLSRYNWHAHGRGRRPVYAARTLRRNGKSYTLTMHRLIMIHKLNPESRLSGVVLTKTEFLAKMDTLSPDIVVDHINRNSLDNRKANLRLATPRQNMWNRSNPKPSRSKYKGVCWHKDNEKWVAQIHIDGQQRHLGYFDNEISAAKAYDTAAKKYRGEYAFLNFK